MIIGLPRCAGESREGTIERQAEAFYPRGCPSTSRLYYRGRYSPRREVGTHHFHTLLARETSDD